MRGPKRFFDLYQYIAPALLTPLSYYLWSTTYYAQYELIVIAVFVPILFAYIVPGIGTNVLKLWKFDSPLMFGNFRIHHGFVYGSGASTLGWVIAHRGVADASDALYLSLIAALVYALLNSLYDIYAIRAGVIKMFNEPASRGKPASIIVLNYGPLVFGGFGFAYIASLKLSELYLANSLTSVSSLGAFLISLSAAVAVPVSAYIAYSYLRFGHSGIYPVAPLSAGGVSRLT